LRRGEGDSLIGSGNWLGKREIERESGRGREGACMSGLETAEERWVLVLVQTDDTTRTASLYQHLPASCSSPQCPHLACSWSTTVRIQQLQYRCTGPRTHLLSHTHSLSPLHTLSLCLSLSIAPNPASPTPSPVHPPYASKNIATTTTSHPYHTPQAPAATDILCCSPLPTRTRRREA
jgi:hypothetical protein